MSVNVHFEAASVGELHIEMAALLAGSGNSGSATTAISSGTVKPASGRTRGKADAQQAIQTGGERADPETSAADKAKDAEDEDAETAKIEEEKAAAKDAAAKKAAEPAPLTRDDVKKVLGGYVQAYGMSAASEDGVAFLGVSKVSEIPDTQADFARVIIAIATGIEKNPKKREMDGDGISKEKLAELKPIVQAALAVK